ncbi:hypothetical protein [Pseudoxanthomonas winnipegensis]|uniref:hypothetical protein n=1 Tax=Pseudoxanthomonas winnipegensis TaxID=2480810 RepID=UPI00102DB016|nr:hypothetical protein [Pseudoxanthomonas winnipegensis]RZZ87048.1 hypothetical protein EA663_09295 [Pseudoxanthomonas winnipegensis]
MEENKKIGYLIIAVSFALLVLCAISSRWYADNGYVASFLSNSGIYLYQTTEECTFCNGSIYISGVNFLGGASGSTVSFFYLPFKYIFFVLLCVALYGSLLIKGVLSVPYFLKKLGGSDGSAK